MKLLTNVNKKCSHATLVMTYFTLLTTFCTNLWLNPDPVSGIRIRHTGENCTDINGNKISYTIAYTVVVPISAALFPLLMCFL